MKKGEPWYMTTRGVMLGLAIQMLLLLILALALGILGYVIGIALTMFGIPAAWILDAWDECD